MKNLFSICLLIAISHVCVSNASAQKLMTLNFDNENAEEKKNIIKLNVLALPFRNISMNYERVYNQKYSFELGASLLPKGRIPLLSSVFNMMNVPDNDFKDVKNIQVNAFSITPGVRMYINKQGYGNGLYIGFNYRFARLNMSGVTATLNVNNSATQSSSTTNVNLHGSFNANSLGVKIGKQWFLSDKITLDWCMFGTGISFSTFKVTGVSDKPLNVLDQLELNNIISELPFLNNILVVTNSNIVTIKGRSVAPAIYCSLSIGFRF